MKARVRHFLWQALLYVVALLPFGFAFLCAAVQVLGRAWGRFPYQPDDSEFSRPYNLTRTQLLCFQYFDSHQPQSLRSRKVKP